MKVRDKQGRFTKNDSEGFNFYLTSVKQIIYWILLLIILFPWIAIGTKLKVLEKISLLFDYLIGNKEENENQKKNGLFY